MHRAAGRASSPGPWQERAVKTARLHALYCLRARVVAVGGRRKGDSGSFLSTRFVWPGVITRPAPRPTSVTLAVSEDVFGGNRSDYK